MNRLTWITLALTALVAVACWSVGGSAGTGAFSGWTTGTLFTGLSLAWQRHQLAHHPERVFTALVQGFLFKLAVLVAGAVALRWIAALAEVADWRGFLVGYAIAVALLGASGTAEILRMVRVGPKEQRAS